MKKDYINPKEKSDFMFVNKNGELEIYVGTKYRNKFLNLVGFDGNVYGIVNYIATN